MSEATSPLPRLVAEALGAAVLVLIGVGTAVMTGGDLVATALAFGLALLVMVAAVGHVSGGHFNPAVSLGAALAGRLSWRDTMLYWPAQVLGGLAGGLTLWVLLQGFPGAGTELPVGYNGFGDQSPGDYAWWAALLLEIVLTALLVTVVLAATDARQPHPALAPVAIGLALTGIHLASIPATGTSVNPARSIGAGVFAGPDAIAQLWLFILAPMLGGLAAGLLVPLLLGAGVRRAGAADGWTAGEGGAVGGTGVDEAAASGAAPAGAAAAGAASHEWPESWPDPGPPREWGQPAKADDAAPWRPPAGAVGDISPAEREPAPDEAGFPPPPNEPYWSQQLQRDWGALPDLEHLTDAGDLDEGSADPDEDDDGRTQIRPNDAG